MAEKGGRGTVEEVGGCDAGGEEVLIVVFVGPA